MEVEGPSEAEAMARARARSVSDSDRERTLLEPVLILSMRRLSRTRGPAVGISQVPEVERGRPLSLLLTHLSTGEADKQSELRLKDSIDGSSGLLSGCIGSSNEPLRAS